VVGCRRSRVDDPRHGRSAADGRTPRGPSVRPRGKPRSVLPATRGRCARICLPGSPRGCEPPSLLVRGGIAQMRPLAPRPCTRYVIATTRSTTPCSLAARREENALRDPAWRGAAPSLVPCGLAPAARCAGRRGGNGPARRLTAAPAADTGETVLVGLPSPELGPSLLRQVPPPPAAGWPLASFRSVPAPPRARSWGGSAPAPECWTRDLRRETPPIHPEHVLGARPRRSPKSQRNLPPPSRKTSAPCLAHRRSQSAAGEWSG